MRDRVYSEKVKIDEMSIHDFYAKRAVEKCKIDIDSPVVLCGDNDKAKIAEWTNFEIENRLPLLQINDKSRVLEVGCGTGRISKFITGNVERYLGVDYVKSFIDIVLKRDDIKKDENITFINSSFQELVNNAEIIPKGDKFNRFIISGGVFMYINDNELKDTLKKLIEFLSDDCIIYISEPVAIEERLTLNKFYSENLKEKYSAIYRTVAEYNEIFSVFYEVGYKLEVNEEFFYEDIKKQKETKQWIFVLKK